MNDDITGQYIISQAFCMRKKEAEDALPLCAQGMTF